MSSLLDRCADLPQRALAVGTVLVEEGARIGTMFVVIDGTLEVSRQGSVVATIAEPGAVVGEVSVLLDTEHSATVTATSPTRVYVVDDPLAFVADDPAALLELARMLARRLDRLVAYLADVKAQYGDAGGHLGLLDEVLRELTYGEQPQVEPGSERDPDPYY